MAIFLAVLLLATCAPTPPPKTLQDGFGAYSARRFDEAEGIAGDFIAKHPDSPNLDEAYYLRGIARFTHGETSAAYGDLRVAVQRTVRADLKEKACRALGDIEFDESRWEAAQADYQQALAAEDPPGAAAATQQTGAGVVSYLDFRIGACLQAIGKWQDARSWFSRVITAKGGGDAALASRALARMDRTGFALQFGAYHDLANARQQSDQLRTGGVTPTINTDLREGQVIYLLQSGTYKTWQEAQAAQENVRGKYPLVTIVP